MYDLPDRDTFHENHGNGRICATFHCESLIDSCEKLTKMGLPWKPKSSVRGIPKIWDVEWIVKITLYAKCPCNRYVSFLDFGQQMKTVYSLWSIILTIITID